MNEYQELIATHQALQERLSEQPVTVPVDEIQGYIAKVREAGARIRDARQREQLRAILRSWGAFVFERAGYYPATQLAPYDGPIGPFGDLPARVTESPRWVLILALVLVIVVAGGVARLVFDRGSTQGSAATPTSSAVISPVVTLSPVVRDTPTPSVVVGTVVAGNATMRSFPDAAGALLGQVPRGLKLTVIARTADGSWLKVRAADETVGWITAGEIDFNRARLSEIAVGILPPTPSATPARPAAGPSATLVPSPSPLPSAQYIVQVLTTKPVRDSGSLRIRESRDIASAQVDTAAIGERLAVYDRKKEPDGTAWLLVRSPRNKQGWARENQGDIVLVARVDQPPPAIDLNVQARVTPPEGVKLKVRDQPSVAGAILGELDKDAQVVVLEGPASADGFTWWKVDNGQGLVGWSAEGAGDARYLVPAGWAR